MKLANQATKRPNIIVFQGSFHGRTHLAMAMTTSKTGYRAGHSPLPSGVFVAPFPARRRPERLVSRTGAVPAEVADRPERDRCDRHRT